MFRPRTARKDLDRYRRKGLDRLERRIVERASQDGLAGARVLEVGGGIGAIQAELLEAGAEQGEIVELVDAYEPFSRELAREKGLEGRVSYRVADLLESPGEFSLSDVVVLNRVVCCSPDGVELTSAAARLAGRSLFLTFPRDTPWARAAVRLLNVGFWLLRRSFRTFVHPPAALVAAAEAEGLRLVERDGEGLWELLAFERA